MARMKFLSRIKNLISVKRREVALADNSPDKVRFREYILDAEKWMVKARAAVTSVPVDDDFPLEHFFTPIEREYGVCLYGRKVLIEKGGIVIGEIHKHYCLNFLLKGKISVATESGTKEFEAPYILVSGPGTKRAGYALEDTEWATVHLSRHSGEENLERVESEIFAKSFGELGLIASLREIKGELQ